MTSCQRRNYTVKAVSVVSKFSGIACGVISRLVVEIVMQKNNVITKFCHLALAMGATNYAPPCICTQNDRRPVCMQFTGSWYEVERTRYSHAADWENTRVNISAYQNGLVTAAYTGVRSYIISCTYIDWLKPSEQLNWTGGVTVRTLDLTNKRSWVRLLVGSGYY